MQTGITTKYVCGATTSTRTRTRKQGSQDAGIAIPITHWGCRAYLGRVAVKPQQVKVQVAHARACGRDLETRVSQLRHISTLHAQRNVEQSELMVVPGIGMINNASKVPISENSTVGLRNGSTYLEFWRLSSSQLCSYTTVNTT